MKVLKWVASLDTQATTHCRGVFQYLTDVVDWENASFPPKVKTIIEDVKQNSKHQQHHPGKENCAAVKTRSFHRENKAPIVDEKLLAIMEAYHQICNLWSRLGELCDKIKVFFVIFCGLTPTMRS
ncbi:hypothetical protein D623_10021915 [Myotis brandtii]|uniref:Uncharacterized protein n=1 Tax=Myotis brandtii TaxID=109478 RepID=S7MZ90_MYOBR|nr:hypothetical protein D623_10021915 [Myotis brandtii]